MKSGIIGVKGEMGKFLFPLLKKLGPVFGVDKESSKKEWRKIWTSDAIWLSIPRDEVPKVLRGIKLKPEQLIVDICSIKRGINRIVKKTGASHLSLHPLQGPYVPLFGQKWVIIPTGDEEKPTAKLILDFLKQQGVALFKASSEKEHDFMMGVVLSLPEFLTIVLDELILQYTNDCKEKELKIEELLKWTVPASNALFSAYVRSIASSADWLREELIVNAYRNLLKSAKKAFKKLGKISPGSIKKKIPEQRKSIENISQDERKRINSWIERWYTDTTQKIFHFQKGISPKPKITLQYCKNLDEVFPVKKGRVTVGIHGIEGCFTHESVLRFCEEFGIDPKNIEFKYLVEAKRVIKATSEGKVDRGVFCIANSGSGAYVETALAMGKYPFEVLAIYGMEIMQCLLAHPSIKNISQIKKVFGHPQAISQCKRTFAEKYPQIELVPGKDKDDTALCAKRIAEGKLPRNWATLASQLAAKIYGLKILEYGMHHDPFNTTTMFVIKKRD
jgi:chorismate mutase/prephenate dehydratase